MKHADQSEEKIYNLKKQQQQQKTNKQTKKKTDKIYERADG